MMCLGGDRSQQRRRGHHTGEAGRGADKPRHVNVYRDSSCTVLCDVDTVSSWVYAVEPRWHIDPSYGCEEFAVWLAAPLAPHCVSWILCQNKCVG